LDRAHAFLDTRISKERIVMEEISTQIKGRVTELSVANEFLKRGFTISQPLVDDRYDFIADVNGKFITLQVKTCHYDSDGYLEFKTCNTHTNTSSTTYRNYKNDNVDYFATFYDGQCYLIPVAQCGSRQQRLRTQPTKNGQVKGITFACDYEIDKILPTV
jgi:hypothetical protein